MPQEPSGSIRVTRSHHTVLPEAETLISVQTHPKAVCFLCHDHLRNRRIQLDADDNGIVRFYARAHKDWRPIEVHLEFTADAGIPTRLTFALRGAAQHGALLSPNEGHAPSVGTVLPSLEGVPLALSNQELMARGYPPRPDPEQSPARYARWHRIVSRPYTAVNPRLVPHADVSFSHSKAARQSRSPTLPLPPPNPHPGSRFASSALPLPRPLAQPIFNSNSNIWSGATITNPINQFCAIQADWDVPAVYAPSGAPAYSAAAPWIGLDNSSTDLYQSGTDSECYDFGFPFFWTFTIYWAWIESLPFAPSGVPNLTVAPGDSISVDIFVADENGTTWYQNGTWGGLTSQDNSVWYMLNNNTRGLTYWGTQPTAGSTIGGLSSTPFTGSSAEFILERPSLGSPGNFVAQPLAYFLVAVMQGCWYGDAQYGSQSFPLGADGSSPFDGNLSYLNMQNSATGNLLDTAISAPDPTSPGGSAIIWLWSKYQ